MMPQRTVLVSAPIPLLALVLSPLGAVHGVMWPYIRVLCLYCALCHTVHVKMGRLWPIPTCVMPRPGRAPIIMQPLTCRHKPVLDTLLTYRGRWCRRQTSNCKLQMGNLHNIIQCSLIFDLNFQQIKHVIDMSILILGSQDPAFCVLTIHEIVWESLHLVQNFSNKP